jgi:thiol-disulfide isomerase/thioredoxin
MSTRHFFFVLLWLTVCLSACQDQPDYCTVKGTVKGIDDGTKLELQDEYDHFKKVATTRVKDGAFEFHPRVSAPTHVYLYTSDGDQLKDFFLEPGTIVADINTTDKDDMDICASGTPSNDFNREMDLLYVQEEDEAAQARWDEKIDGGENGILALYYASNISETAVKALTVLDRLSPDIASKPYIAELREELGRRAKTEPAPAGSKNYFIDMEYPDAQGKRVSLSSVVNNPANRYVLLDFWATWCSPCRESVPALRALYAKYHAKGLEIYSVSEDSNTDGWKSFLPKNGMTWVNVLDDNPGRKNSKVWSAYALHGIPTTLLLDGATGEILVRDNLKRIEAQLSSLLP